MVLIGDGEEATRKRRLLEKTDIEILGFQSDAHPDLKNALEHSVFAIISVDAPETAWALAKEAGCPVNVVDRPDLCDFTIPSILERGALTAAIGSAGTAPVLAKSVRASLETLLPKGYGPLTEAAERFRPAVKSRITNASDRRKFWEQVLTGPLQSKLGQASAQTAQDILEQALEDFLANRTQQGVVHIVGAGPGDPDLLTLKAFRLIQSADIVFYDRLVSDDILDMIRRDAHRHCVGKSKGDHSVPQKDIHTLMIEAAREGQTVVRLKGGDPFIFGRGGEEVEAVRAAGIDVFVTPGISSALGCAASAGVPLTHRDHAQSVTFVTGHAKAGGVPDLDWPSLARSNQTLVVFMGVGTASDISAHLIEAGRNASTPVLVVENGTRDNEIRIGGRLSELPGLIEAASIKGPALLFIGEVAALSEEAITQFILESAA